MKTVINVYFSIEKNIRVSALNQRMNYYLPYTPIQKVLMDAREIRHKIKYLELYISTPPVFLG